MLFRFVFLLVFLNPTALQAERMIYGPVLADVVKVRDGDSVDVIAHPWPGHQVAVSVRLRGIDAPELRGKCDRERHRAKIARDRLQELLSTPRISLTQISGGKYFGRVLARITTLEGVDVQKILLLEKLVRRYRGGKRLGWCGGRLG